MVQGWVREALRAQLANPRSALNRRGQLSRSRLVDNLLKKHRQEVENNPALLEQLEKADDGTP